MKKLLGTIIMALGIVFTAAAQQTPATEKPASKKEARQKMAEELGLTKEQGQQMQSINKSYRDKIQAVKEDTQLPEAEKKEKMKTLNTERQTEVDKILTPEQQVKMKELKKEKIKDQKGKGRK